jgi:DNA-binding NarL/FixJ family response regulator
MPGQPATVRPSVLLVDPDDSTRAVVAQALIRGGCDVVAAVHNYAQAIVASRRSQPTVVVTELVPGAILSPADYLAALNRHCPAPVIIRSMTIPSAREVATWRPWAAIVKTDPIHELIRLVHSAHAALRGASR